MKTRTLALITFVLLLSAWFTLVLSEVNAAYLLDVNAAAMVDQQPPSWGSFVSEDNRLARRLVVIEFELWPLYALFWAPLLGILLAHKSRPIQYLILISITLLLLLDIKQFLLFEGGDRKGCESCLIWWTAHLLTGAVASIVAVITAIRRGIAKH